MDNLKNDKKILFLSLLAVIAFIAGIIGLTYAYFVAQGGTSANTNVNVQTNTTDNLSFQVGNPISFSINQENFGQGMGNQRGSTTARATLTANNATNTATENYYVYLNIGSNDFEYTTEDSQAELLLKVTNPDGTEVTTLGNLERKTSGGETGFDITTATGLITIADNYEIIANPQTTQEWNIEIVFVNLDSDQNANTGKSFSAELIIQKEAMGTSLGNFATYITNLYTEDGVNDLYYHDGAGTYGTLEAGDNSYRYAGANPNNYVCFGATGADCQNGDNQYRIIGVFGNQVKLIKHDYVGSNLLGTDGAYTSSTYSNTSSSYYKGSKTTINRYYWNNSTNNNNWNESNLNTVNLNTNYLNNVGSTWASKIAEHTWRVGGNTSENIFNVAVKSAYTNEITSPAEATTYNAKIGLMYVSDYGYAASPENWNTNMGLLNNDTNRNNNWMFMGLNEWTISRQSDFIDRVFFLTDSGYVRTNYVSDVYGIRPSFYLASTVEISSGTGTSTDPYVLKVN